MSSLCPAIFSESNASSAVVANSRSIYLLVSSHWVVIAICSIDKIDSTFVDFSDIWFKENLIIPWRGKLDLKF